VTKWPVGAELMINVLAQSFLEDGRDAQEKHRQDLS
jgi:hypothetical protein